MEFLERISLEGGLVANPIVIDDSSSNPDAVEDTDQLNDNNTDQFDEIDQDLLSETSFDDLTGAGLVSTSGNDDIIIDTEGQENSKIDSEIIDSGINIHVDSDASVARDLIFTRVEHNEFDKNDNIEFKTEDESNLERADSEVIDSGINKCFVFEDIVSEKMSEEGAIENDDGLFIIDEDVEDSNLVNDSFVPKEAGVNIPLEEVGFEHDKIIIPNSITEEAFEHNGHTDGVEEKGNISSPLGKRELDVLSTGKN